MKPQAFIASSREGLDIAKAIQSNLKHVIDSTTWANGVFGLNDTALSSLIGATRQSDIAVFVLSPDDITRIRGSKVNTARDNVIFELGLFAGTLGARRIFFVIPEDPRFHLPTDLHGITAARYVSGSHQGNMMAQMADASNQIELAVKVLTTQPNRMADLNGKWTGTWDYKRKNYPKKNTFEAELLQTGNFIRGSFKTNGEEYSVRGDIFRGDLFFGMWGDPTLGSTYFGPLHLVISGRGDKMVGMWCGFTSDAKVAADAMTWTKVTD